MARRRPARSARTDSGGKKKPAGSRKAPVAGQKSCSSDTEAVPNEWHKRSAELNPKYKSQLCKNFMEKGPEGCRFGDCCVFAHGAHELRIAQKHDVVAKTRRSRGTKANKAHNDPKPRVQFREEPDELQCQECSSRPVTPVADEGPEPVPEWATAELDSVCGYPVDPLSMGAPLLVRSDSVLAADSLFLDDNIDTSTVADGPVVYGEEASPNSQLSSRFSFANATPREAHPKHWVSTQVVSWVRSRGIPDEVAALFGDHEVDGEDLLSMTKTELREVGVNKMGHLMKLTKGIAELNGTAASAAMTAEMAPQSQPAYATCSLKGMADVAPSTSMVSAQAVGQSQLIAEAADVIKKADNVPSLNDVLQSAVMANKIAEVIRGESESMPLTLCMLAAKFGRAGCLKRLLWELAAQETLNTARVDDGCTALHLAAYGGSAECVKLLLNAGADTTVVNRYGETPLDSAAKRGHGSLLDVFAQIKGTAAGQDARTKQSDSKTARSSSLPQDERSTKIMQPRRYAKKSRDTLANELSAWRNGVASAA